MSEFVSELGFEWIGAYHVVNYVHGFRALTTRNEANEVVWCIVYDDGCPSTLYPYTEEWDTSRIERALLERALAVHAWWLSMPVP